MLSPLTSLGSPRTICRALIALMALCFISAGAQARSIRTHNVKIAVVGDSLANDLANGLEDLFGNRPNVHILKQTRFATGLVRTDYYDWDGVIRKFLHQHNPDVILVVIGGNDHQAIRVNGNR